MRAVTARILIAWVLVCTAGSARAADVTIVIPAPERASVLGERLAESHRVTVMPVASVDGERRATLALARERSSLAANAFRELDAKRALELIDDGATGLFPFVTDATSAELLAALFRLKGRAHLFREEPELASRAFAAASEWAPSFSPRVEEWAPEARLAYSDARAQRMRGVSGAVSIRVEPACAAVAIDGVSRGMGSSTVPDLAPGAHVLSVSCPGYVPFGGVFSVKGAGSLAEQSVFLERHPDFEARRGRAALTATTPVEFEQLGLSAEFIVRESTVGVEVLDANGRRLGDPIPNDDPNLPTEVLARLAEARDDAQDDAWYENPWLWVGAAAVLVGGGAAIVVGASSGGEERVRLVIGR
ncbi:MAG: PEGA domain-containing protein [Myxococcota bacterium]